MATTYQSMPTVAARPLRPRAVREPAAAALAEREHRAAVLAEQRGLSLEAGPAAVGGRGVHRSYMLTEAASGVVVAQGCRDGYGLSIDQVEECLRARGWG